MEIIKREEAFWEKYQDGYESLTENDYEILFKLLPKNKYVSLLEIGCADGGFSKYFNKKQNNKAKIIFPGHIQTIKPMIIAMPTRCRKYFIRLSYQIDVSGKKHFHIP